MGIHSHATRKLGKKPPVHDRRTLQFAKYVQPILPKTPLRADWFSKIQDWSMSLNDSIGDCTIAGIAHHFRSWAKYGTNADIVLSDDDVLAAYERIGGYVPGDVSTDNGCALLDVLKAIRATPIGGQTIEAFVSVSPQNDIFTKDAIFLFGGLYVGVNLPLSAQAQDDVWDIVGGDDGAPGSWGGHAIAVIGYDARFLYFVSWGKLMRMTWAFFKMYADEAYGIVAPQFFSADRAPNGFDHVQLRADLALL